MARRFNASLDWDDAGFYAAGEAPRARRRRMSERAADRRACEIDRSQTLSGLERAAKRLRSSRAAERVLAVPQWNMDKAAAAMRNAGVSGVVTNLCGSRRQRVESKRR